MNDNKVASGDQHALVNRRQMLMLAWPIILANITVPLLGLVDTAVIGHTGSTADLGAIALGALLFNLLYWAFGFLRMGTSGFVARSAGAGDEIEIRAALGRALLIAAMLSGALLVLQWPIAWLAVELFSASTTVESTMVSYLQLRIWGAPATLGLYALFGVMVGLGESRALLKVQLLLNGGNIVFDIVFAAFLGWGVQGVAVGTAIAEWLAFVYGINIVIKILRQRAGTFAIDEQFWPRAAIARVDKLRTTLKANGDIMVRTLLLQFGFIWFADQSARFGDATLAGNHVLQQFIMFSAFFLDGFAYVAESQVGQAAGSGQLRRFDNSVKISSQLAAIAAALLALLIMLAGPAAIIALTSLTDVQHAAAEFLPYAAIYVFLSFAAFQLDGIFIGSGRTRDLRQAAIVSTTLFILAWWLLARNGDNADLWLVFTIFVVARALALAWRFPALRLSLVNESDARH